MSQKLLSRNKNGMLAWSFTRKKRSEKKNPGFEREYQIQISGTVENLTTGCQSEICVLPVLCNAYQIISVSHGKHTSSSVLTIAWKDSVKTTLGWHLMHQSIPAVPIPPLPQANPLGISIFLKNWANSPGWGQKKRANALPPGLSPSYTSAVFLLTNE